MDLTSFGTVAGLAVVVGALLQGAKVANLPDSVKPYLPLVAIVVGVLVEELVGVALGDTGSAALASRALIGLVGGATATWGYQALVVPLKSPKPPGEDRRSESVRPPVQPIN